MMCVNCDEVTLPVYEKFIEKNNCMHTNGMLEIGVKLLIQSFSI